MKNRKKEKLENYLEKVPQLCPTLVWDTAEDGCVCLHIKNQGVFNRTAQWLFLRPKVSHIKLDEMGSFVWHHIDGKRDIIELGRMVEDMFGKDAYPLYERVAKFFRILESNRFIDWIKDPK